MTYLVRILAYQTTGSALLSSDGKSTKYVTVYKNGTAEYSTREILYKVSKIGDATKEVRINGNYGWYGDYSNVLTGSDPFAFRGGLFAGINDRGIFCANNSQGIASIYTSFRVTLGQ